MLALARALETAEVPLARALDAPLAIELRPEVAPDMADETPEAAEPDAADAALEAAAVLVDTGATNWLLTWLPLAETEVAKVEYVTPACEVMTDG